MNDMESMKHLPTHPGEVLKEELESRGISQKRFSELIGVPYTMLNEILNAKRGMSTDFVLLVEAALGINPQMLINTQNRYNLAVAMRKTSMLSRLEKIHRACAAIL